MKKIFKDRKAITLIALVITIVILVILASVAITLSLGNNGIFNKTKYAKEEYLTAVNEEQLRLARLANEMDENGIVSSTREENNLVTREEYESLLAKCNKAYTITHPELWSTTEEIDLGDGLYGRRITGNIGGSTNDTSINVSAQYKIVSQGGYGYYDNDSNAKMPLPYKDNYNLFNIWGNGKDGLYHLQTSGTTSMPYDIWITYTK